MYMKEINFTTYKNLLKYNCNKGKHRPYENLFGVTWCTVCGCIMKDCVPTDKETHLPKNIHDPLYIKPSIEELETLKNQNNEL